MHAPVLISGATASCSQVAALSALTAIAISGLKKSMRWDEETYGREYDLDIFMIVAVNDFNMGAMENKGLNIFNSSAVLARAETGKLQRFKLRRP